MKYGTHRNQPNHKKIPFKHFFQCVVYTLHNIKIPVCKCNVNVFNIKIYCVYLLSPLLSLFAFTWYLMPVQFFMFI